MKNFINCPDCNAEQICYFIKSFIQDSELEYEIVAMQGLNVKLGKVWIHFNFCPYCGKKLRTFHSRKHWHLTEVDVRDATKEFKECNYIEQFLDNSEMEYKVGKDGELLLHMDEQWISFYYCPDCGEKIKL